MTVRWRVPDSRVVGKNDARTNLSAIILDVEASGRAVYVGGAHSSSQFCTFISCIEYKRDAKHIYNDGLADCEVDVLRKNWSIKRRVVENTGQVLRITKGGVVVAFLVPTEAAYDKNIDGARAVIEKQTKKIIKEEFLRSELALELKELNRTVSMTKESLQQIRSSFADFATLLPTKEELEEFRKGVALVKRVLPEWKAAQG